jgi:predicted lysophospholipase L1 biosynthesis ABC-type transport system permease subunit
VLYDIAPHQRDDVMNALEIHGAERVDIAPLVQGRLTKVNEELLGESDHPERRREARNEHKLTYAASNIDGVTVARGDWWGPAAILAPRSSWRIGKLMRWR